MKLEVMLRSGYLLQAADFDLDHGTDVFVGRAEDTLVVDIEHGGVAVVVYGLLAFGGLSGGDCFYAGAGESVGFEPFFEFRLEDCGDIVSGDFPEVHYLVVGLAGSAASVQFIEEEVPVKGYVDVFAETVYESPAFAEAGAAFEVHVRGCRQFEYALEYGCHPPVLFD